MDNLKGHLVGAYSRFHDFVELAQSDFPGVFSYEICHAASNTQSNFPWKWGVADEIRETINAVNAWGVRLHHWRIWLSVIASYDNAEERFELERNFLEPIAYFCMFQPSGLADRLLEVVENALHQANLMVFPGERDRLDQDKLKPGRWLPRKKAIEQLDRLGERWAHYRPYADLWNGIDSAAYRTLTRNFRNLSAHSFAPRFEIGLISRARRSIGPANDLVEQPDGSLLQVERPDTPRVQYGMGVIEPISFQHAHTANLAEYQHALVTMHAFATLIEALCQAIETRQRDDGKSRA